MDILYVVDNIEFGGGERNFAQIINRLPKDRYKVMVVCMPGGVFEEEIRGSGAQIRPVDMGSRFNILLIFRLAELMKREGIHIVHSQGGRADFFARIAAKLAKVPKVVSTVAMPVEGYDVGSLRKTVYVALDRFTERFVDRFIVVSQALRKVLILDHKIAHDKVIKIYPGIVIEDYHHHSPSDKAIREEFRIEPDIPIVGAIGRLVWQKGFSFFIHAAKRIVKVFSDVKFLIVGEGPLHQELKMLSKRLEISEYLVFTGFRRDIPDLLSGMDILVIPSLKEGLPAVLLEGMAMAKPIVATNIDGISEIIRDGETGLLVPPGDPEALAEAITSLLKDRDKAMTMGRAGRRLIGREFSVEEMVRRTQEVYESMVQGSKFQV